jgi:hypothetical protein
MTHRVGGLALLLMAVPAWAQTPASVPLALRPAAAPVPALKVRLLADPDVSSANAAPLYCRAALMFGKGLPDDERHRLHDWKDTPLNQLPQTEIRQFLERHKNALQEVALGARRATCDWELPLAEGSDLINLLLPELQALRDLGLLLAVQARLALAEGHTEQALASLQTGFALARHLGQGPFVIQALVGDAVALNMLQQLPAWVQQPGAPNLYWALTALPEGFADPRKYLTLENAFLFQMFPVLRDLDRRTLSPREAEELEKVLERVVGWADDSNKEGGNKEGNARRQQAMRAALKKVSPEARQFLLGQGRTAQQVDALPVAQAVAVYSLHRYRQLSEDLIKWLYVPYWQAQPGLKQAEERTKAASTGQDGVPFVMLVTGFNRVALATTRPVRAIAALRCVEAIRMYAAAHGGKLPATLGDITDVPVPVDPVTGRPFTYQVTGDKATLSGPVFPGEKPEPHNVINYELTVAR